MRADTTPPSLVAELNDFLRNQHIAERVLTETRQRKAARELQFNRKSMNGLGRPRLEVDSYAYHLWGQKLGYKCWKDPQFLREFERDNEHCRVRAKGTRDIHVGWVPTLGKRFTKSYGC